MIDHAEHSSSGVGYHPDHHTINSASIAVSMTGGSVAVVNTVVIAHAVVLKDALFFLRVQVAIGVHIGRSLDDFLS